MRALVLVAAAAMGEVAARDDELRAAARPTSAAQRRAELRLLARAHVEVGDVEDRAGGTVARHSTSRAPHSPAMDESAEIFDDLYLGLRAGGAMRKQRRGEPLTAEEQEALGRWQRLSAWRKAVAIGGFALGTFGLGFTLGGLVFGRWRKA